MICFHWITSSTEQDTLLWSHGGIFRQALHKLVVGKHPATWPLTWSCCWRILLVDHLTAQVHGKNAANKRSFRAQEKQISIRHLGRVEQPCDRNRNGIPLRGQGWVVKVTSTGHTTLATLAFNFYFKNYSKRMKSWECWERTSSYASQGVQGRTEIDTSCTIACRALPCTVWRKRLFALSVLSWGLNVEAWYWSAMMVWEPENPRVMIESVTWAKSGKCDRKPSKKTPFPLKSTRRIWQVYEKS